MKIQRNTLTRARRRWALALALGALTPIAGHLPTTLAADEFGTSTRAYEDDAWYDVSEWFDGNDYNPTDEAIGRWDDDSYDASDAATSADKDTDIDWSDSTYGYYADNANGDDSWFYDYYDSGYADYSDNDNDGYYDHTVTYYDYDNDGIYDSGAEFADRDSDGIYENYTYVGYADSNAEQDKTNQTKAKNNQKSMNSKVVSRSGSIKAAKKVKTPHGTNLVVVLSDTQKGENVLVDLGSAKQYETMPQILDVDRSSHQNGDSPAQRIVFNGEEVAVSKRTVAKESVQVGKRTVD